MQIDTLHSYTTVTTNVLYSKLLKPNLHLLLHVLCSGNMRNKLACKGSEETRWRARRQDRGPGDKIEGQETRSRARIKEWLSLPELGLDVSGRGNRNIKVVYLSDWTRHSECVQYRDIWDKLVEICVL